MTDAARLRAEIANHGTARREARAEARRHLDEIGRLAPDALAAGIDKVELARLAQISRMTLDKLLGD